MSTSWGSEQIERRRITRSQYVEDMLFLLYPELKKPLGECRLLDLGSGLGTNAIPAAKIVRSVFGIDTNAPHVNRAREWAEREGLDNVALNVGITEKHPGFIDEKCFEHGGDVAIRDDFIRIHVGRRARSGLENIERKLFVPLAFGYFHRRLRDGLGHGAVEESEIAVHLAGEVFDHAQSPDEITGKTDSADLKIVQGPLRLRAPQGGLRDFHFAERIFFDPVFICHGVAILLSQGWGGSVP